MLTKSAIRKSTDTCSTASPAPRVIRASKSGHSEGSNTRWSISARTCSTLLVSSTSTT